ncbi:phytanoyl-CoA dioxygenase family protein [Leptospira kemamanensis]|nr:phytanoyl-CoA dioxygenase family protein [Leptospira kemamanensis]
MDSFLNMEKELIVDGFYLWKGIFPIQTILQIKTILQKANAEWKKLYDHPLVINSAYLTSTKFIQNAEERDILFQFIASKTILEICKNILKTDYYFLNTQIFFNPVDDKKLPYWHRDIQYLEITEEEQKTKIQKDFVWHFRIPLEEDPGIWIVPGSHIRWDHEKEREVRLEMNNHRSDEPLTNQILIPHDPGDLFVFSSHLLHKGEYGKNRFSFDILYTNFPESKETVAKWDHFPNCNESSLTTEQRKLFVTK